MVQGSESRIKNEGQLCKAGGAQIFGECSSGQAESLSQVETDSLARLPLNHSALLRASENLHALISLWGC